MIFTDSYMVIPINLYRVTIRVRTGLSHSAYCTFLIISVFSSLLFVNTKSLYTYINPIYPDRATSTLILRASPPFHDHPLCPLYHIQKGFFHRPMFGSWHQVFVFIIAQCGCSHANSSSLLLNSFIKTSTLFVSSRFPAQ